MKNDTVKKIVIGVLTAGVFIGLVFLVIDKLTPTTKEPIKREVPQIVLKGPEGVLAKVGDIEVKSETFFKMLAEIKIESMLAGIDMDDPKNSTYLFSTKQELINRLIEAAVYEDYATKNDLLPTQAEIKKAVNSEIEERIKEAGSLKQLEKSLEGAGGIEKLRQDMQNDIILKSQITRQKVSDHILKTLVVTEKQAKEFFESKLLGVSQIVVLYDEKIDGKEIFEETKKYANDIRDLIGKEGRTFSDVAYAFSEERATGQAGGKLDQLLTRETMPKEAANVLWSMKIGDISPVVQLDEGFFIFKIDYQTFAWQYFFADKKTGQKPEFDKIIDQVIQQLKIIKGLEHENEWYTKYSQSLKTEVYVDLTQPTQDEIEKKQSPEEKKEGNK